MNKISAFILLCLFFTLISGCTSAATQTSSTTVPNATLSGVESTAFSPTATSSTPMSKKEPFTLLCPVLEAENMIPTQYSCNGKDVSLPLAWGDPPEGTKSLVLIMDDPDAKAVAGYVWIHWVIFNLPPETRNLAEDIAKTGSLPDGGIQGKNSFGRIGYGGPCPPSGLHHYVFKLYALDTLLNAASGATSGAITLKMNGHILAQTELVTTYRKH
jgi:Raf kinase inhibitor-like YbhB/YbcL family protein